MCLHKPLGVVASCLMHTSSFSLSVPFIDRSQAYVHVRLLGGLFKGPRGHAWLQESLFKGLQWGRVSELLQVPHRLYCASYISPCWDLQLLPKSSNLFKVQVKRQKPTPTLSPLTAHQLNHILLVAPFLVSDFFLCGSPTNTQL